MFYTNSMSVSEFAIKSHSLNWSQSTLTLIDWNYNYNPINQRWPQPHFAPHISYAYELVGTKVSTSISLLICSSFSYIGYFSAIHVSLDMSHTSHTPSIVCFLPSLESIISCDLYLNNEVINETKYTLQIWL